MNVLSRRRFLSSLTATALAAGAPGRLLATDRMKKVALLMLLDLDERDDPKLADRFVESNFIKPFAELNGS